MFALHHVVIDVLCSISVQQLISLAYNALNEGLAGSTQYACQMFSTVRNMFELFCHVAPVYHHSNMDAVPHTAGVHLKFT